MKKMIIQHAVIGQVFTNVYFLMHEDSKEMLIVDPADDASRIVAMVGQMQAKPVGILLTHGHYDHILAAETIRDHYDIPIYAGSKEEEFLADPSLNLTLFTGRSLSLVPDVLLEDGQESTLAGFSMKTFHTPGHTKGSVCYYFPEEEILISGDTLFHGSVGRTDLPTGSSGQIVQSLHRLLEELPEETQVLPGHDTSTSIGYEKRYNPFV